MTGRWLAAAAAILLPASSALFAQTFSGTYSAPNDAGGRTVVTLQQSGESLSGSIVGNGNTFQLQGVREGDAMVGFVTGAVGGLLFEARLDGDRLHLTLVETDAWGQPAFDQASILVFERDSGGAAAPDGGNPLAPAAGNPPAPADPWVGAFVGGNLRLELQGGGGSYSGTVTLDGQAYEAALSGSGGSLSGSFSASGSTFPLTLSDAGDGTVILSTGGASYTLSRAAAAPANPLAGGAAVAPAPGARAVPQPGGDARFHDGTALGREWYQFLAGKKATRMDSYSSGGAGGYSSRTDVHLCADGSFALRDASSVSVDVGGAYGYDGGTGGDGGRWRILTQGQVAGIELTYSGGMVEQYRLDHQGGATYVDGERWYVTPSDVCGY